MSLINGEYVLFTESYINNIYTKSIKFRISVNSIFFTDCIALMYWVNHNRMMFITILVLSRYREREDKILNIPPKNHTWFTKTFIRFFIWDWQFWVAPVEAKFVYTFGFPDEFVFTQTMKRYISHWESYYIHPSQILNELQFHLVWQCFQCFSVRGQFHNGLWIIDRIRVDGESREEWEKSRLIVVDGMYR